MAERRTVEDIRAEMASERAMLEAALVDLRRALQSKRRPAAAAGGLVATGLAAAVTAKVVRKLKGR